MLTSTRKLSSWGHWPLVAAIVIILTGCNSAPSRPTSAPSGHDARSAYDNRSSLSSSRSFGARAQKVNLSPAQQRLEQSSKAFKKTVMEGAVLGAIAGGVLGYLTGDATGAAIGALTGAAAGGVAGKYVADKQKRYADREARINAQIADVNSDNQRLRTFAADARAVIEEQKAALVAARSQYDEQAISRSEMAEKVLQAEASRDTLLEAIEGLKEKREQYQLALKTESESGGGTDLLDASIKQLESEIAALVSEVEQYSSAIQLSRV